MTFDQIANELGWVIRPGTKVKASSFANMIERLDPEGTKADLCKTLRESNGTIVRNSNGVITINQ